MFSFVILIPFGALVAQLHGQLYSGETYILLILKVNCHLCIFNTIRLFYYNLMICLKYHCKAILEEIDSFSTGEERERKRVYLWWVGVVCLRHAGSNYQSKWMSLWVGSKSSVLLLCVCEVRPQEWPSNSKQWILLRLACHVPECHRRDLKIGHISHALLKFKHCLVTWI
jgi:hypothetical protein